MTGPLTRPLQRPDYRNRNALVMGLGVHGGGAGVARFLAERGARVTVTDLQPAERLAHSIDALRPYDVRFVLGEHREADFAGADFVVRNPGVPRNHPCLQVADSHRVPIYMEMTLFFLECPSPRISAVTGTKGKTTTTTLIGEIVRAAGRDVVVAGNLRVSALEQLPLITPHTEVVLELSSFQLEGLEAVRISPATACITNLMADHLNRYPSLESYFEAKTHIFRHQDTTGTLVLNRDDPHSRALAGRAPGLVQWFSIADDIPGADASRLRGEHNRANMAAAAAVARALRIADATTGAAIGAFRGVPYRQELVREREGVQFVNDSAATTPDALMAALAATERPVVLIAGGADKELDFTRLGDAALAPASPLKAAVLLEGSATDKVQQALGPRVAGRFGDLRSALLRATELASTGDVVLLSPGCASFGMFANEFDRGDQYNALVQALD